MLLKNADDKSAAVAELEALAKSAGSGKRREIEEELRNLRAGLKGEREAAYLIDFEYGKSLEMAVIHDLRLEVDGRVAQIDHLLIHRSLHCFVLETKHVHAGLKITESGEFLRWNDWKRTYDGMASPLAQNERHISVLRDAFRTLLLPERAGVPVAPVFHSYVLVPSKARIDRPATFDSSRVVKMDLLAGIVEKILDRAGVPRRPTGEAEEVSRDRLENLVRQLLALHKPAAFDYRRKFGTSGGGTGESFRGGGQQRESPRIEFPPGWPERQWQRQNRRTSATGRDRRLAYAAVGLVLVLLALYSTPRKVRTALPHAAPPVARSGPAAPAATGMGRLESPAPEQRKPPTPVRTSPTEPVPALRWDERSLSATGKGGGPIAELRGNLPKIKQEMRASSLGARPTDAEREAIAEPKAGCELKPVMTEAEIAACRHLARRP